MMVRAIRSGTLLRVGAATAVLLTGGLAWALTRAAGVAHFHATSFLEAEAAPAFILTDHTGRPASLADHRGEAVLVFFGFTHCPDVCPLTLQRLSRVRDSLGRRGGRLQILLVSVDPTRDTPDVLADYLARFGPGIRGLTGSEAEVAAVRHAYGVYTAPAHHPGGGHGMAHTDAVFGLDRQGRLRVVIAPDAPEAAIRADIETLLRL
jgi:protein SCO1